MIKNKRYAVSFEVVTYRNNELHNIKQTFCTMSGEVTHSKLRTHASHIIKEGKREVYEPACGSALGGEYVIMENKLGNILNVTELPESTGDGINYEHAYAEDSRYNYNG
jgi:hypothetical protein